MFLPVRIYKYKLKHKINEKFGCHYHHHLNVLIQHQQSQSASFSFFCTYIILNTLEDNFLHFILIQNQYKLLQCKDNDFFLLELHCLKKQC